MTGRARRAIRIGSGKLPPVPPPPILVKTPAATVRLRGEHIVIVPAAGAKTLAHQQRQTRAMLVELWIRASDIYDATIRLVSESTSLLQIRGAFHGARTEGESGCLRWIGPLATPEIGVIRDKLAATLGLPREVNRVTETELAADPERLHGRWIEVAAWWHRGLERSDVAGLWLEPIDGFDRLEYCSTCWTILGRVDCDPSHGYGHFGMSRGQLNAVAMTARRPS